MVGRTALVRLTVASFLVLAVAGQSSAQESPPPFTFTDADLQLLDLARQFDKALQEKGQVYDDSKSTAYVTEVAGRLAPPGPAPENVTWSYHILRDPTPNAFALPNGSIYVDTGLLGLLQNEAQLASVLAHEQTHVLNRHSYLENRSIRKKSVGLHVLAAVASAGSLAGGVAGASVALAAQVAPFFVVYSIFGYSRELEREADVRAVTALTNAGYSGEEMVAAFRLLDSGPELHLESEPRFYADHPKLQDRIAYTSELVKSAHPPSDHAEVGGHAYAQGTERVLRHDIGLEIMAGRMRSAVAEGQSLVGLDPASAENSYLLGEAYRALGPRTPVAQPAEQEPEAKSQTRKMLKKMTLQEYEAALAAQPGGQGELEANDQQAEKCFRRALELDSTCAKCYRGLGLVYEKTGANARAVEAFRKYLELAPAASDRFQISRRIEKLEPAASGAKPSGDDDQ